MRFSFIIPAHNEEKYISFCLKSIFELDGFGESEIIVVDNASEDNTDGIVRENFPQVKLIQEVRKGTGWARQAGFRAAKGEILAFIDADNVLPKNWLKQAEEILLKYPNGVAYSGPYDFKFGEIRTFLINFYYIFMMTFISGIFNFFGVAATLLGGNMIIKRYALEKIGGFDTHITFWGDDTLIAKRLRKVGPVYFLRSFRAESSTRRLAGGGMFKLAFLYPINALWVILFNKPFTKSSKAIR